MMDVNQDEYTKVQWQVVHADYVLAHHEFMKFKLMETSGDGQLPDPMGARNARNHLRTAQQALHEFCKAHLTLPA
jgi:hypothetical protein